jgi:heme-degrading monooxygenase HmoA
MILELAEITVTPGSNTDFEAAVAQAEPLFLRAEGCHGIELRRGVESPERYLLLVRWETLEHHTEKFRSSEGFTEWRHLVGPFFAEPPRVEHFEAALPAVS